ncbi:MAG: hypothetical protein IIA40_01005 [SAR324 cluster bacterium]|nr:hypothetical protein [SAR324 cluster bacterium]
MARAAMSHQAVRTPGGGRGGAGSPRWGGLWYLACAGAIIFLSACSQGKEAAPAKPTERLVALTGRVNLTITLPPGYALASEHGADFEVHHVWRRGAFDAAKDANLGIYVGVVKLAYCRTPTQEVPGRFGRRRATWRRCESSAQGMFVREAYLPTGSQYTLHVFILGRDAGRMDALQRIAETLRLTDGARR